jgi:uncharacterized protein YkwD
VGFGPIRRRFAAALAVMTFVVPTADAAAGGCSGSGSVPTASGLAKARKATLCLLNKERSQAGLKSLRADGKLRGAADTHSEDMVARSFFDHVAPGGVTLTDRVDAVNYLKATASSWMLAENIGWGSGVFATPKSMVQSWMESPGHKANILNPAVRDAGIGIAIGSPRGGDGATYTLDLGRRG